MSRKGTAIWVT